MKNPTLRSTVAALAFALVLVLGACGGSDDSSTLSPSPASTAAAPASSTAAADANDDARLAKQEAQAAAACPTPDPAAPLLPISAVQGPGERSPVEGSNVTVRGVVTADLRAPGQFGGFYVQQLRADDNPATSEGLFVFAPDSTVALASGAYVQVQGPVLEFQRSGDSQPLTQIAQPVAISFCSTLPLPRAKVIALPVGDVADFERWEGMLVRLPQTLTVSGNFTLGRFGELVVAGGGRLYHPNNHPTLEADAVRDLNARSRLVLDDASNVQNPNPIPYLSAAGPDGTRRAGDTLRNAQGILTWAFDAWRLQPTVAPTFRAAGPRPAAPQVDGTLRVASLNVLNFFSTLNQRGANSADELQRQQDKLVATLVEMDADIVGLIEIENDGPVTLARLVDAVNARVGAARWAFRDAGFPGTDAIKVATIYRRDRVVALGNPLVPADPDFAAAEGLRPPVAQRFAAADNGGGFWFVVNHFKSKGSCPSDPASPDADLGQGCWNASRVRQAQALARWVGELVAASGEADVLLAGDFNAYTKEDPISTLRNAGYENLLDRLPAAARYSFVFEAEAGALDHAFASEPMRAQVSGVAHWHSNADEPVAIDYNLEFKTDDRYAPTPWRASDHDPVVVGLRLAPDAPAALPTLDATLPRNAVAQQPVSITAIAVTLAGAAPATLTIDWGDGSVPDAVPIVATTAGHVYAAAGTWFVRMTLRQEGLPAAELVTMIAVTPPVTVEAGLYISEYVEGSSFNKAIEIHNPGTAAVDLSAYTLALHSNGSATPTATMTLEGTLAPDAVIVIHHASWAAGPLPAGSIANSAVINFNGDDALVLARNGAVLDQFGQVGFDPGTAWTSGTLSTLDRTLRRKAGVAQGSVPPSAPAAWDLTAEWDGFPINAADGLGCASHANRLVSQMPRTFDRA